MWGWQLQNKNNKSKKHTKHCNKVSELLWTVACPSIELVQLQTTATMTLKSYRLNHSSTQLCFALPHSTMGSTWLLYSTTLYHCFTFLYLTLTHFTIAIPESTWVDTTLDNGLIWLHLTLLLSTMPRLDYYLTLLRSTMAKPWILLHFTLDSTWLFCTLPRLYVTLLHFTMLTRLLFSVLHSTMSLLNSTLHNYTLQWFYMTLLHSVCLYITLLHSTLALLDSTSLCMSLLHSTLALLDSTLLHFTIFLLNCTTLYHGSTWFYFTPQCLYLTTLPKYSLPWFYLTLLYCTVNPTMALLKFSMALLYSTLLYYTLPLFYLLHSFILVLLALPHSTLALLDSTSLKYILLWLYLTLLISIIALYCILLYSTLPLV